MKKARRSLVCASLVAVLVAITMCSNTEAQAADPFMGTWKLNVAKSKFSPGPAPKTGSVTFSAAGSGFKAVIQGAGAMDEKVLWEYTGNYDGKDVALKGNPDGDMISVRRINATTVETTIKRAGKPTVTNVRSLSPDGKTMTVTTKGTNGQGQTVNNVQVFEKG